MEVLEIPSPDLKFKQLLGVSLTLGGHLDNKNDLVERALNFGSEISFFFTLLCHLLAAACLTVVSYVPLPVDHRSASVRAQLYGLLGQTAASLQYAAQVSWKESLSEFLPKPL
ncbi:cAMP-dependent protein kinase inhibitor beta isoform X1 [Canis lupus baileyi]|uniref:cAMP-dependent protein kinase inhibitor beta isoform X1 n=1 Tax=Canis lupus baileyi TaxID=143281 RepID=UPI003B96AC9C